LKFFKAKDLTALPELVFLSWRRVSGLTSSHLRLVCPDALGAIQLVCFLTATLLALLDVAPASAAAAKTHLYEPGKNGKGAGDPHEGEHGGADLGPDVQLVHATDSVLEDDEEDGCDDRGYGYEERVEEGKDGDEQGEPARVDGDWHEEDEDEGETGAG